MKKFLPIAMAAVMSMSAVAVSVVSANAVEPLNTPVQYAQVARASLATPKISKAESVYGGVKLTWNKVNGAAKYRVYYKGRKGWTRMVDTTSTSYIDKDVSSGRNYTYTVRCISADGKSFTSGYDSKGTTIKYIAAPEISKLESVNGGVKISWGKVSGATKYRVYYKGSKGWTRMVDTTSTSYIDKDVSSGRNYTYTVRCITSDAKKFTSGYNPTGKSVKYVATPKISKVESVYDGTKITWNKVNGAEKYRVYYKGSKGWIKLSDTTSNTYINRNVKLGQTYIYTVRCINSSANKFTSGYDSTGKKATYSYSQKHRKMIDLALKYRSNWNKNGVREQSRVAFIDIDLDNNLEMVVDNGGSTETEATAIYKFDTSKNKMYSIYSSDNEYAGGTITNLKLYYNKQNDRYQFMLYNRYRPNIAYGGKWCLFTKIGNSYKYINLFDERIEHNGNHIYKIYDFNSNTIKEVSKSTYTSKFNEYFANLIRLKCNFDNKIINTSDSKSTVISKLDSVYSTFSYEKYSTDSMSNRLSGEFKANCQEAIKDYKVVYVNGTYFYSDGKKMYSKSSPTSTPKTLFSATNTKHLMTNGKDVIYTVANASNNDVYLYKDNKTKRLFSFKGTIKLITVQNNFLYFVNGDSHLCEYDYVNNKVTVMFGVDVHDVVSLGERIYIEICSSDDTYDIYEYNTQNYNFVPLLQDCKLIRMSDNAQENKICFESSSGIHYNKDWYIYTIDKYGTVSKSAKINRQYNLNQGLITYDGKYAYMQSWDTSDFNLYKITLQTGKIEVISNGVSAFKGKGAGLGYDPCNRSQIFWIGNAMGIRKFDGSKFGPLLKVENKVDTVENFAAYYMNGYFISTDYKWHKVYF